jgi:hypothetical protein
VKEWECKATGQRETLIWRKVWYRPMGDPDDPADADVWAEKPIDQTGTLMEQERLEQKRQRQREQGRKRAKRTCRYKIKAAGFSSMLTCTYRENMTDFDRMRADWNQMLRKLAKAIPGFRSVYGFEQQERGAWHVHAAIDRLPTHLNVSEGSGRHARQVRVRSWDYIRRLWHSIVGRDNGNIDVDGHRRTRYGHKGKFRSAESLAKLAGYISKYLTKEYADGLDGRNMWGSTQGLKPPKACVFDLPEMPLHDAIELAFHLPDGHRIVSHRIGQFGKFWSLFSEPGEPDIPDIHDGPQ